MATRSGYPPQPPRRTALWRLGAFAARRRTAVTALSALLFLIAVGYGAGALNALSLSRLEGPPGREAAQARAALAAEFGPGAASVTLLGTADDGDVDSPASRAAGRAPTEELAAGPAVSDAYSYWDSAAAPALRGEDGSQALVVGFIP